MNENEVIKALECCINQGFQECKICPLYIQGEPCEKTKLPTIALDLINRQKAEIEELKRRNQNLTSDLTSAKAEIERLKNHNEMVLENCRRYNEANDKANNQRFLEAIEIVKSEARKEFAERLKEKGTSPELDEGKYYSDYDIDRTLAEMESESNV